MIDTVEMAHAVQDMINDIDNRLTPNADKATSEAILSVLAGTTDVLIKELHGTHITQSLFQAVHMQRAIIQTMFQEQSYVEIKDPVRFYTSYMENSRKALVQMYETLKGNNPNCAMCSDKEACEAEGNNEEVGEKPWVKTKSVH